MVTIPEERRVALDAIAETIYGEIYRGPSVVSNEEKRYLLSRVGTLFMDLHQKLPAEILQHRDLRARYLTDRKLTKNQARDTQQQLGVLRKRIMGEHGYDPEHTPRKATKSTVQHLLNLGMLSEPDDSLFIDPQYVDPLLMENMLSKYSAATGREMFTPQEEAEIVTQYGCEDLLDLSWI